MNALDMAYLRLAIEHARANPDLSRNKAVGAVLVSADGRRCYLGARRHERNVHGYETKCTHAEDAAIEQAGMDAVGGTIYATLSPCGDRIRMRGGFPKRPCCELIVAASISRVVFGAADSWIGEPGIEYLRRAGVQLEAAPAEISQECLALVANPRVPDRERAAFEEALGNRVSDTAIS